MPIIFLFVLLVGCGTHTYSVSSFAGVTPAKPQAAAEHECKAYAFSEKIELKNGFVACMAKYGWKVTWQ